MVSVAGGGSLSGGPDRGSTVTAAPSASIDGDGGPPSLQSRLTKPDAPPPGAVAGDPAEYLRNLEASGRFHRDRGLGRIFHPGKISLRESVRSNSLHISIDGDRMTAHVDRVSPLSLKAQSASRYSLLRIAAHNASGMAGDLVRLLRGRQGDHRCELDCRWSWGAADDPGEPGGDEPASGSPPPSSRPGHDANAPAPPSNVQLEARVAGRLDESRLRAAMAEVLGPHWRPEALSVVDCPDDAALHAARTELQGLDLPLTAPALRAVVARSPDGDVVMANLHYAVMDGFGALQVLRAIARSYAAEPESRPPLRFLALRELPVRSAAGEVGRAVRWYRAMADKLRDVVAPTAPLARDQAGEGPGTGYHLVALSTDDTRDLVQFDHPGTHTDVLLSALHLAIATWNAEHGRPSGRISVLVSANLRSSELPEDAVGNFSVTARVSTSRHQRARRSRALDVVTAQTGRNRRSRTGIALLQALERAGLLALWAKQSVVVLQPLTGNHSVDSAMLCNLGRLTDPPTFGSGAGDTVDVWFSPPTRLPLGLSIGAATISGRLHLAFRYPHRLFGEDAARRFAECYVHQLRLAAAQSR